MPVNRIFMIVLSNDSCPCPIWNFSLREWKGHKPLEFHRFGILTLLGQPWFGAQPDSTKSNMIDATVVFIQSRTNAE